MPVSDAAPGASSSPALHQLSEALLKLVSHAPAPRTVASDQPRAAAESLARKAASQAALTAGTLALPPGPLGWLTVLPELLAVWQIQAQLVVDIAALHGLSHAPSQAQMLHCLFRHATAQALRDLGVRLGERLLVKEASVQTLQRLGQAIGLRLSQRALASGASRWVPLVGAVGVGAYAWADTRQVARTAIELFESESRASRQATASSPASHGTDLPLVERIT